MTGIEIKYRTKDYQNITFPKAVNTIEIANPKAQGL